MIVAYCAYNLYSRIKRLNLRSLIQSLLKLLLAVHSHSLSRLRQHQKRVKQLVPQLLRDRVRAQQSFVYGPKNSLSIHE